MQSYIPLLSATFESLNDDTLTTVLQFVGDKSYKSFGSLDKHCREIYLNAKGMTKQTFVYGYAPLSVIIDNANMRIERKTQEEREGCELLHPVGKGVVLYNRRDVLEWALQKRNKDVLIGICDVAAGEGRIDLLNEVLNNVDDTGDVELIFDDTCEYATIHGELEVLKWLNIKGLLRDTSNEWCAILAANCGQLHILKWLREVKGLKLDEHLYQEAIGHMHVLKWLREKEIPWRDDEYTFYCAAKKGNLEVLQYLHDEGCPWRNNGLCRLREDELKSEILNWLRANGYSDGIH